MSGTFPSKALPLDIQVRQQRREGTATNITIEKSVAHGYRQANKGFNFLGNISNSRLCLQGFSQRNVVLSKCYILCQLLSKRTVARYKVPFNQNLKRRLLPSFSQQTNSCTRVHCQRNHQCAARRHPSKCQHCSDLRYRVHPFQQQTLWPFFESNV